MQFVFRSVMTLCFLNCVFCARILAIFPITVQSHHNLFHGVLQALAERGHEVVSYTSVLHDGLIENHKEIPIRTVKQVSSQYTTEWLMRMIDLPAVGNAVIMIKETSNVAEEALGSNELQNLLKSNERFDLVILQSLLSQEALLGFGHKFNAPVINLQTFNYYRVMDKVAGNSLAIPYIPEYSLPYTEHMSLYEKLLNAYSVFHTLNYYYNEHLPRQDELVKRVFNDPAMPSVLDMVHNISIFMNNERPNLHYAHPQTPNIVNVGGIHLERDAKPLPQDMKQFLDGAKHGAVYISMGSLVPDHVLSPEYFQNFLKVFRRLPLHRFLWKTRSRLQELPDNVMTTEWAPQQDVLAHHNVVLFMTHGGLFSAHEAIHAGVPVVSTPYFCDQLNNARFYQERGAGLVLPFRQLSEQSIYSSITAILNNTKYRDNMRRLSLIYRDQPMTPQQTAVYWVEYVIRHRGAPHLRPASTALTWYQLALLDVVAAILAIIFSVSILVSFVCHRVFIAFNSKYSNKHCSKVKIK